MSERDFAALSFSTEDFPERERLAMLREHYGRTVLKAEIEAAEGVPFEARITRTREHTADGNDDLALVVSRTGTIAVTSRGRETLLGQGEAVLTSSEDETTFERFSTGDSFSLRIPRSVLLPLVIDLDDAIMRPIPQDSGALRLLTTYAGALMDESSLATSPLRQLAVAHLHDLLALALGAPRDVAELANGRGVKAARLREAKAYIASNSSRKDISIASAATHLGVTPRYLQRLFEADGSTFSSFLLGHRLKRAHRLLCEPQFAELAVSSIAYDVGFGDLSYFNRCFRRIYGVTPSDVRKVGAK